MANTNPQPADTTAATDGPIDGSTDTPVLPVVSNPRGYPPFDLRLLPTYTNNQLRYYHISGAMLDVDEEDLTRQLNKRHAALKAINWNGDSRENTPDTTTPSVVPAFTPPPPSASASASRTLSLDDDGESDSDCPQSERKGVKVSASEITTLKYNSTLPKYNNWL